MIYNEVLQRGTSDFPIELYHVDKQHVRYGESYSHWHGEVEFLHILSGKLTVRLNNNTYCAQRGDILFINSETVHYFSPDDCVYECIVFSTDLLPEYLMGSFSLAQALKNHEYVVEEFYANRDSQYSRAMRDVFSAMKCTNPSYKFKVMGALNNLFAAIVEENLYHPTEIMPVTLGKNVNKLRMVLAFIRGNYDAQITLNEMAESAEMSPKYFCHFFKAMTTKTPIEYLNFYRIEMAIKKLINSDMSVTEVAFSCGFNDLSYFIKTFKQVKGVTPAKYRKSFM
ncbi:MAG: helix-turn-helix domain-containing protein [Ruminococcaceae bacterium]|nr:helix-turn-helix domain-containing protein [Oscillospiraceae bacterium]